MADGNENVSTDTDDRARRDAAIKTTTMMRDKWLTRRCGWHVSRRGNPYIDTQDYNIALWRVIKGWRFRILHKPTGVTWQSDSTPIATEDEAKIAALDKLSKRLPEFLRRLAAERSRG